MPPGRKWQKYDNVLSSQPSHSLLAETCLLQVAVNKLYMLSGPESRYCWAEDAAVDSYGYPRLNYMDIQYVSQALSGFSDFMDFGGNCS